MKKCTFKISAANSKFWQEKFDCMAQTTLLQSPLYAAAAAKYGQQYLEYGEIFIDDAPAGVFITQHASICRRLVHAVMLDRGPLWFDGFGGADDIAAFAHAFNDKYPRRLGRKRRFIPEISNTPQNHAALAGAGFVQTPNSHYETFTLDITRPLDDIHAGLRKNWRGALTKAQKSHMTCTWHTDGAHYTWLIDAYAIDKKTKGYNGASVSLLNALAKDFIPAGDMIIGIAQESGQNIAGVLILRHGHGATYQIGYSTPRGRAHGAHNMLLWAGIKFLKHRGVQQFDLGGVHEGTNNGIRKFKAGLGGRSNVLAGLYT